MSAECPSRAKDDGKPRRGAKGNMPKDRTALIARGRREPKHATGLGREGGGGPSDGVKSQARAIVSNAMRADGTGGRYVAAMGGKQSQAGDGAMATLEVTTETMRQMVAMLGDDNDGSELTEVGLGEPSTPEGPGSSGGRVTQRRGESSLGRTSSQPGSRE